MVGTILNNTYKLESALAKGGMGQIFIASHLRVVGRYYAIKQLHPELAVAPNFQVRFRREAEVMMTLDHPNIVRIDDFLIEDSIYYLVMEFVEGESLDHRLMREKKFAPAEIHRLSMELLAGLDYCHNKGVIHRDLKPSNLLLTPEQHLKITDFGIALQDKPEQRLTNTGTILGTPDYMSPEQIIGKPLDGRSDLYAVGAIMYEMAVGHPPFPRLDETEGAYMVLFAHVHKQPPSIEDPSIPAYLKQIIACCLHKDPQYRFASARELAKFMQTSALNAGYEWITSNDPFIGAHSSSGLWNTFAEETSSAQSKGETQQFLRSQRALPSADDMPSLPKEVVAHPAQKKQPAGVYSGGAVAAYNPKPQRKMGKWLTLLLLILLGGTGYLWWNIDDHTPIIEWFRGLVGMETQTTDPKSIVRKPDEQKNISKKLPIERNDVIKQKQDQPTQRDQDTPPTQRDQDTPPTQRDQDTPPTQRGQDTPPTQRGQDTPPTQRGQDTPPTQRGQDTPPTQRDQDTPPTQRGQDTPPTQRGQDTPPTQRGQDTPPTQRDNQYNDTPDRDSSTVRKYREPQDSYVPSPLTLDRLKKLKDAKWPQTVSKLCARLLRICVSNCLNKRDEPSLEFALDCRRRCWKLRIREYKGQKICP
jgi:serine/threonine protein kinase